MFSKLNIDWHVEDYKYGEKIVEYGTMHTRTGVVPKITYHVATGQCEQLLSKLIPERYRIHFNVAVMDITAGVGPHTDNEILVTINHYIQTNDERTVFYTPKPEIEIITSQIENQTNGVIFDVKQLDIFDSFSAKANETWILDVTKPHSVVSVKPSSRLRKAIVIQTCTYSYEQVMEMFVEQQVL